MWALGKKSGLQMHILELFAEGGSWNGRFNELTESERHLQRLGKKIIGKGQ